MAEIRSSQPIFHEFEHGGYHRLCSRLRLGPGSQQESGQKLDLAPINFVERRPAAIVVPSGCSELPGRSLVCANELRRPLPAVAP